MEQKSIYFGNIPIITQNQKWFDLVKNQGVISPDQLRSNNGSREDYVINNQSVLQNLKLTQDKLFPDSLKFKFPKNTRA